MQHRSDIEQLAIEIQAALVAQTRRPQVRARTVLKQGDGLILARDFRRHAGRA